MKLSHGVVMALALCERCAFAADIPVTRGEPVIVTATRFEERAGDSPIGVQVITEEDIRSSAAATVPELLSREAGIRVRDLTGSPDMQVDMRGFGITGDQNTVVLIDGRRASENELTSVSWSAIPLSAIDRIEVMRGSGAVLYGAGATAGTINIITKPPQRNTRSVSVYGGIGKYDTNEERVGLDVGVEDAGIRLTASNLTSAGYRDNNGLRERNAQADVRHYHDGGFVSVKIGAEEQNVGLPGALSEAQITANRRQAATPGDFANRRSGYVDMGAQHTAGALEAAANLAYREKDTHASFFVATPFRNNIDRHVSTWSFAPRLKLTHRLGGWGSTLVSGFDLDDWQLDGQAGPALVAMPGAVQRNGALYVRHTTDFPTGTTLVLGYRSQRTHYGVEDRSNTATTFTRDPRLHAQEIALRQRVIGSASIYGRLGRSFRLPNVDELFSLFTATVTPLEPQTAREREIGFDIAVGTGRYHAAYYDVELQNEIYFESITFINRNLPPTRRRGVEAQASWRLPKNIELFLNYTYTEAKFRQGQFGGVSIARNDVPLVPRHAANAGATWLFRPDTRATVLARYVGQQRYDADEANSFPHKMPSYTVVDAKMLHDRRDWQFAATVRNLFNEKYYTYAIFTGFPTFAALPAPERSAFVSAQYTFR